MDTMHTESNRLIAQYEAKKNATVATLELNQEQAEFLANAMEWWKTSGVNIWSVKLAEEIEAKLA